MEEKIADYLQQLSKLLDIPCGELALTIRDKHHYSPLKVRLTSSGKAESFHFAVVRMPEDGVLQCPRDDGRFITYFSLIAFPGCCAFCISTGVSVCSDYKRKGVNNLTNLLRLDLARLMGYSAVVATDVEANEPERRTLKRNGWSDVFTVTNRRTGNVVNISVKAV